MQVINKKIIVIFICLCIFIFGLFKIFNNKEIELDNVVLDIRDTNNTFAIYLENEYESNSYEESEEKVFPSVGYSFNKEKSQCVSIDGDVIDNILSYDYETNKVIVDTTDSINCYLYFDRLSLGDAIKVLKPNGLNLAVTSNSDEWTGMYRFQGQQEDGIENYICFGTSDSSECKAHPDKYMYRIIGIEESGRIKVIKKEAMDKTYQWHTNNFENITWPNSIPFNSLNRDDFLNNKELVPNGWEDKIDDNNWLYGNMKSGEKIYGAQQSGVEVYKIESGTKEALWYEKAKSENDMYKNQKAKKDLITDGENTGEPYYYIEHKEKWNETSLKHEVDAKIGLMYVNDYYLSISNTANCQYDSHTYENICDVSWMNLYQNDTAIQKLNELTITRYGLGLGDAMFWELYINSVTGSSGRTKLASSILLRPVFFLKNNIHLIDGNGTIDEPFIIK